MRYYVLLYHASWFWFVMCSLNAKQNRIRTHAEPCFFFFFFFYSNDSSVKMKIIIRILITVLFLWSFRSPGSRVMLRSVREYGTYQRSNHWASPNPIPLYLLPQKNSLLSTRMQNPNAGKFGPCLPSLGLTEPERPGSVLRHRETLRLSPESRVATEGEANTLWVRVLGTVSLLAQLHMHIANTDTGIRATDDGCMRVLTSLYSYPIFIYHSLFFYFWDFWCSCLRAVG